MLSHRFLPVRFRKKQIDSDTSAPDQGHKAKRKKKRKPIGRPDRQARRALLLGRVMIAGLTLIMVVLLGRVAQLQSMPPKQIEELIDTQYSAFEFKGRRAPILDRNGRVMAVTSVASKLFVDPGIIEDFNTFSERVGYTLGYDPATIERAIGERLDRRYVVLDQRMTDDRIQQLRELNLRGVGTEGWLVRDYPYGSLAAPIVGFVQRGGNGLEGMELAANEELNGRPGHMRYLRDASRNPLFVEQSSYQSHEDGRPIYLTLDVAIQKIAEQELAAQCLSHRAKAGMLVVMDPHTGDILAMANYPSYDLNNANNVDPDLRRNRCVTDQFEPGSTFKPFIWAAAVEGGYAHPDEMFDAEMGFWISPKGRKLRDAHPYGMLSFEYALVKSSNIIMAKVGMRMGIEKQFKTVRAFGFGEETGSGLSGEVGGLVWPLSKWTHYSETSVPMGQEVAVTALQMVRGFSVFANDGNLVTPRIRLAAPSDELESQDVRIMERVLLPRTADITKQAMRKVITDGTGRRHANSEMYDIFGKSGTAQVAKPRGGYIDGAYNACFVAGAPYDHPRVVVGCFIHRPDPAVGHFGGAVSGPVVKNVIERTLVHLGVPPNSEDEAMVANY